MTLEYQEPEYSKSKVRKAAKYLVENKLTVEERQEYIRILANFRSSHNYPMQSMIVYFRKKALEIDKKAIVVRRLKRIPSIIDKLKRFPSMQVTTMGDIGGIRIITKSLQNVQKIRDSILKGRTKNTLLSEKDYLASPKDSGYRGIHVTYSYQGRESAYKGFRVELQIRSHIQHAWATAVEIVGTFLQINLKAGKGDTQWLNFFRLVSLAFSDLEAKKEIAHSRKQLIESEIKTLQVLDKMLSFSITAKHSDKKEGFYLLQLDIEKKRVRARHFSGSFLLDALDEYRRIEQEISEDNTKDVVLVSAQSLEDLKKAYPNYFADTHLFLWYLEAVRKNTP